MLKYELYDMNSSKYWGFESRCGSGGAGRYKKTFKVRREYVTKFTFKIVFNKKLQNVQMYSKSLQTSSVKMCV